MAQVNSMSDVDGRPEQGRSIAEHVRALVESDPKRWDELLNLRTLLSSHRSVLLIGRELAPLAVLLSREGVQVSALDSAPEALFRDGCDALLAEWQPSDGEVSGYERLDESTLGSVLAGPAFDAVVVTDGYRFALGSLVDRLARSAATENSSLYLSVPFGNQAFGDQGFVLPSSVAQVLHDVRAARFAVSGGRISAQYLLGRPAFEPPTARSLLELTEAGSSQCLPELASEVRSLRSELSEVRAGAEELQSQLQEIRESTSFQIGLAFAHAVRSPRALAKLPLTFVQILRNRNQRSRSSGRGPSGSGLSEWQKEELRSLARKWVQSGGSSVIAAVDEALPETPDSMRAFAYLVAAQACGAAGRHDVEFEVATRAVEMNGSIGMLRGYLHVALRCRQMPAASDTLKQLHVAAEEGNGIAKRFLKQFEQTSSYKISVLEAIPERPEKWTCSRSGRFVYVLHNSLPHSSGGYATRSHGVATGLSQRGHAVVCLTRPGFPLDIKPDLAPVDVPLLDLIDGVPYQRVSEPGRQGVPEYKYVLLAADRLEAEFRRLDPAYVQAASNYVTGLPALIAARRLGIPFIYEVRGLWEITRMSRDKAFGESISFDVQRHIEASLAKAADHVFTLTEPMREELMERGVDPARITLLPNSVDASRFRAAARDEQLATSLGIPQGVPVIGYVGTFVAYEGLEDLAEACVKLHRQGRDFRLLLVGNENASGQERGPITEEVLRIAREGGIESKLILAGRVPHELVEAYYSLIDICPFPRKPWPVCEMVSPMKPLEALALEKAVVVSSVRALTEMIQDGLTGVVFEKGSVDSLAAVIGRLLDSESLRGELGRAGREWVVRERAWSQIAERIEAVLAQFEADRQLLPGPDASAGVSAAPVA